MEKYIDIASKMEQLPKRVEEMLRKWECIANRAYIDGYLDGLDKAPYRTRATLIRRGSPPLESVYWVTGNLGEVLE